MQIQYQTDILHHVTEDFFHLAPIPFVYHRINNETQEAWHLQMVQAARRTYTEPILEVPDVRHIQDLGAPPQFTAESWTETKEIPAIGVWHCVPTNGFLKLQVTEIQKLVQLIKERYANALHIQGIEEAFEPHISESWIQFYKASDYKVLHNHEGYVPPYWKDAWSGAYYIDDREPDSTIPYSGILSFRIRQRNYYFRPRPGLLLMWPSDLLHEVHPFYGSRERVVVNFNIHRGVMANE